MRALFGLPLRPTMGFVQSLLRLAGLDRAVPDFSTLCRRRQAPTVTIPHRGGKGPLNLLIDSTGIKAEGEGAWNAREHGSSNRRIRRKIHLAIDEEALEVRAVALTGRNIGDAPVLPELRDQIPTGAEIGSVTAGGAYDTRKCHEVIAVRNASAVIPPRSNAKPWTPNSAGAMARNEALRASRYLCPCHLATMERTPPPQPRREQDELHQPRRREHTMTARWPERLLLPTIEGYGIAPGEAVLRTEMEAGPARQRRRYTSTPSRIAVRWVMDRDTFAIFEAWYRWVAVEGGAWFEIALLGGLGLVDQEARFTRQFEARPYRGRLWEVTDELEVRARPTLSQGALAILLVVSLPEVLAGTEALHTFVHRTLPALPW